MCTKRDIPRHDLFESFVPNLVTFEVYLRPWLLQKWLLRAETRSVALADVNVQDQAAP